MYIAVIVLVVTSNAALYMIRHTTSIAPTLKYGKLSANKHSVYRSLSIVLKILDT